MNYKWLNVRVKVENLMWCVYEYYSCSHTPRPCVFCLGNVSDTELKFCISS